MRALQQEENFKLDERLLNKVPPEVTKLAKGRDGWYTLSAAAAIVKRENYLTNVLDRTLLRFNVQEMPDVQTMALIQAQTEVKYRQALVRPLLYRDKYQRSNNPRTALTRMLQKYIGKTHELSHIHSQADEYFSVISQFERYDETLQCDVLTDMMKEIFEVFSPAGHSMTEEELEEVMELYFGWVLENDYDGQEVPFSAFEAWFLQLSARITRAKDLVSDFAVGEARETDGDQSVGNQKDCTVQ
jgi:hypothetical protein